MWTISIHMEDKWQHKLNIAKWKSKDARSELKAVSKQTNRQKRNKQPLWQLTIWDSYLPAFVTFPKADLHVCTTVAYTSLAPGWLFFPLRNLSIREVYLSGSKFLPACGYVHHQLSFATCSGGTQAQAALTLLFHSVECTSFIMGQSQLLLTLP